MNKNMSRYMLDPVYHASVDLIVRAAIWAIEEADYELEKGYHPNTTQYKLREKFLLLALLDLGILSLGLTDG